jgi:hypothetical protein
MSVAMKCDICGKFYEKGECSHVLKLNRRMGSGNYTNVFEGDICDHCLEKLSVTLTSMGCIDNYINKRAEECLQEEGV